MLVVFTSVCILAVSLVLILMLVHSLSEVMKNKKSQTNFSWLNQLMMESSKSVDYELSEKSKDPNKPKTDIEDTLVKEGVLEDNSTKVTSKQTKGKDEQTEKIVRQYDLIIFAASGGVGKFLVEELALIVDKYHSNDLQQQVATPLRATNTSPQFSQSRRVSVPRQLNEITWAIAGRSAMKLHETLCEAELSTGVRNLSSRIPIVLADLNHHRSLLEMCQKTELIINCAGPYSLEGEAVIRACIEAKTNYIDLAHETAFIERVRQNYSSQACQKGIYIINGCGFQSMSAEMGLNFIKQVVDGELNEVRIIMNLSDSKARVKSIRSETSIRKCGIVTGGMWNSLLFERVEAELNSKTSSNSTNFTPKDIEIAQKEGSCKKLLRRDTETLVKDMIKIQNRDSLAWLQLFKGLEDGDKGYCVPLNSFTSEESQMIRGEMASYEHRKPDIDSIVGWKPIRCTSYLSLQNLSEIFFVLLWLIIFEIIVKFSPLRSLMKMFPTVFSVGNVSTRKLDRDSLSHIKFCQTFHAYGTPGDASGDPLEERNKDIKRKQEKLLVSRIVGPEPNHVSTATYAIQAALTLISEKEHLPKGGGVMTPGVAFYETNIIYQLRRRNIKFEVLKKA